MTNKPEPFEIIGAAAWASALVNGDYSGLNAEETAALQHWLEVELSPTQRVLDVKRDTDGDAEDPWFSWSFYMYTHTEYRGGELLTYIAA